jgi:hypothetical protein
MERLLLRMFVTAAALGGLLAVLMVGATLAQDSACVRVDGPGGVYVNLANDANAEAITHVREAVARGEARILHWDPDNADRRRSLSLRGVPTRTGFDRDEYPPAASVEGGTGADIAYIDPGDNRSAGSRMSAQMRPYCDGQAFILEP